MPSRSAPLLVQLVGIIAGLILAAGVYPAVASAGDDPVCTAQVDSRIEPASGQPGTAVVVSWNFGTPGPLVVATWDGQALLHGVEPRTVDDCYRGVDFFVPADAQPGVHTVVVSCAFCLVPEEYARLAFTVTGSGTPTPPATAPSTPPAPRPPGTGSGAADRRAFPSAAIAGLALLFVAGVVAGIRQMGSGERE